MHHTIKQKCRILATLAALTGLGLTGCRPGSAATPEGATSDGTNAATRQLLDDLGREVEAPVEPRRVVAATPFAVEMLYDLGLPPVARPQIDESQVRPAAALELPAITIDHGAGPNLEQVAGVEGDLLVTSPSFAPFAQTVQDQLELPVLIYAIRDVADVPRIYRQLGAAVGRAEAAEQKAQALEAGLSAIADRHANADGPTVFAIFGAGEAHFAFLPQSYLGSMVRQLGGRLVTDGLEPLRPGGSMGPFSMELVVERQPDLILIVRHGGPEELAAELAEHPAWAQLPAVRGGRVHRVSEWQYLTSPGPDVVEATAALEALLYPALPDQEQPHD